MHDDSLEKFKLITDVVVKISPELFSALKEIIKNNQNVESKLKEINNKLDNLIIREIQAAFQIIEGVSSIDSEKMKERHLIEAESNLLRNISLDFSQSTAGFYNYVWSAHAYYGLSLIALLRGETKDATRFLLKTFLISPRWARLVYAPVIYTEQFKPECKTIIEDYEQLIKQIPEFNKRRSAIEKQIKYRNWSKAGISAASIAIGFLAKNVPVGHSKAQSLNKLNNEINELREQLQRIPTAESLKENCEKDIDEKCKELVKKVLE